MSGGILVRRCEVEYGLEFSLEQHFGHMLSVCDDSVVPCPISCSSVIWRCIALRCNCNVFFFTQPTVNNSLARARSGMDGQSATAAEKYTCSRDGHLSTKRP